MNFQSNSGSSLGGYTCVRCGTFIASGTAHGCSGYATRQVPQPSPFVQPTPGEAMIASALNRLAAAIERLAEKDAA